MLGNAFDKRKVSGISILNHQDLSPLFTAHPYFCYVFSTRKIIVMVMIELLKTLPMVRAHQKLEIPEDMVLSLKV